MRKTILGTTAIVAVSTLAMGAASASEKIKLGVGGYMQSTYYYADYDMNKGTGDQAGLKRIDDRVTQEGEVFFTGSTTLDNGLKFGVNIQLEARHDSDQVDETYIYVQGAFGRVLFGSEDSAAYLMHYAAPSPVPMYSGDSPNIYPIGTGASTRARMFGDADKISYFTPRFGGIQLGASYVPDDSSETGAHSPYSPTNLESDLNKGYSIAANYVNKLGAVNLNVSAGYQSAQTTITTATTEGSDTVNVVVEVPFTTDSPTDVTRARLGVEAADAVNAVVGSSRDAEDMTAFSIGSQIGIAGFTLGGGYKQVENTNGVDDYDSDTWSAGVKYGQGPWSVGVQYSEQEDELGSKDLGSLETWTIGGQYNLGPGVTAFGGVQLYDNDLKNDDAKNPEIGMQNKTTVFFVGTALSF